MSRAYRIKVKESLSRHVQADDRVTSRLELLPVLPPDRTRALLEHQLRQRGYAVEGDVARKTADEVTVSVDLAQGEVTVEAEGHLHVDLTSEQVGMTERPSATAELEAQLRKKAKAKLEREAQAEEAALRQRATAALEQALAQVRAELDDAVTKVTAEALKQRASELGTVEAVHEDANGGLTIKVRV